MDDAASAAKDANASVLHEAFQRRYPGQVRHANNQISARSNPIC